MTKVPCVWELPASFSVWPCPWYCYCITLILPSSIKWLCQQSSTTYILVPPSYLPQKSRTNSKYQWSHCKYLHFCYPFIFKCEQACSASRDHFCCCHCCSVMCKKFCYKMFDNDFQPWKLDSRLKVECCQACYKIILIER